MKKILFLIFLFNTFFSFSQDCLGINININENYAYTNNLEKLEIPFNQNWKVYLENEAAVLVMLKNDSGEAMMGIMKNKNGYYLSSAHQIDSNLVLQLVQKMTGRLDSRILSNVRLKNIPAKQIEYDYSVQNLSDSYSMSGIMYMIIKGSYTYVFMLNCQRELKNCYIPFFKNIIKNTYFGPDWY